MRGLGYGSGEQNEEEEEEEDEQGEGEEPRPLISGRVLDEDGRPAPDAHVSVVSESGSISSSVSKNEETLGEFEFDRLMRREGEFAVKASTPDGRIAVVGGLRIGDPLNDLVLTLEKAGTIALSLEGERDRCRCALISDAVWFEDFTLRKGQPGRRPFPRDRSSSSSTTVRERKGSYTRNAR